jgi:hypothetical protein
MTTINAYITNKITENVVSANTLTMSLYPESWWTTTLDSARAAGNSNIITVNDISSNITIAATGDANITRVGNVLTVTTPDLGSRITSINNNTGSVGLQGTGGIIITTQGNVITVTGASVEQNTVYTQIGDIQVNQTTLSNNATGADPITLGTNTGTVNINGVVITGNTIRSQGNTLNLSRNIIQLQTLENLSVSGGNVGDVLIRDASGLAWSNQHAEVRNAIRANLVSTAVTANIANSAAMTNSVVSNKLGNLTFSSGVISNTTINIGSQIRLNSISDLNIVGSGNVGQLLTIRDGVLSWTTRPAIESAYTAYGGGNSTATIATIPPGMLFMGTPISSFNGETEITEWANVIYGNLYTTASTWVNVTANLGSQYTSIGSHSTPVTMLKVSGNMLYQNSEYVTTNAAVLSSNIWGGPASPDIQFATTGIYQTVANGTTYFHDTVYGLQVATIGNYNLQIFLKNYASPGSIGTPGTITYMTRGHRALKLPSSSTYTGTFRSEQALTPSMLSHSYPGTILALTSNTTNDVYALGLPDTIGNASIDGTTGTPSSTRNRTYTYTSNSTSMSRVGNPIPTPTPVAGQVRPGFTVESMHYLISDFVSGAIDKISGVTGSVFRLRNNSPTLSDSITATQGSRLRQAPAIATYRYQDRDYIIVVDQVFWDYTRATQIARNATPRPYISMYDAITGESVLAATELNWPSWANTNNNSVQPVISGIHVIGNNLYVGMYQFSPELSHRQAAWNTTTNFWGIQLYQLNGLGLQSANPTVEFSIPTSPYTAGAPASGTVTTKRPSIVINNIGSDIHVQAQTNSGATTIYRAGVIQTSTSKLLLNRMRNYRQDIYNPSYQTGTYRCMGGPVTGNIYLWQKITD